MGRQLNYVSADRVIAKLYRELGLEDIDETSVIEQIGEALEAIGTITLYEEAVAFVEIEKGLEGLVHNSEITGLRRVVKPEDELKIGQTVNAKIINIDKEKLKIGLSIKEIEGTSAEYGYEEYISQQF